MILQQLLTINAFIGDWITPSSWFCLQNIVQNQLFSETLDIYTDEATNLSELLNKVRKPFFISRLNMQRGTIIWRNCTVDTILIFKEKLPHLLINGPRGRVILLTKNKETAINLWLTHGLLNLVVITTNEVEGIKAYTWFPFEKKISCRRPTLQKLDTCTDEFKWNINLYPQKLPKSFYGCNLTVATVESIPTVVKVNDTFTGPDIIILKIIAESLGFCPQIVGYDGQLFYDTLNRTAPQGAMGLIHNGTADFVVSNLYLHFDHNLWATALPSPRKTEIMWMLPKANPKPRISGIYSGLPLFVWIIVFSTILAVTITASFIAYIKKTSLSYLSIILIVIGSPYSANPESAILRMFLLLFQIYSLHIIYFYQSTLLGNLFLQPMEAQLTTVEDAIQAGVVPTIAAWLLPILEQACVDLWEDELPTKVKYPRIGYEYQGLVEEKTDFILATYERDSMLMIQKYPKLLISEMAYTITKPVFERYVSTFARRDGVLTNLFYRKTSYVIEFGLYKYWESREPMFGSTSITNSEDKPLDLEILQGAFYLLISMLLIANVVFCIEQFVWKFHKLNTLQVLLNHGKDRRTLSRKIGKEIVP